MTNELSHTDMSLLISQRIRCTAEAKQDLLPDLDVVCEMERDLRKWNEWFKAYGASGVEQYHVWENADFGSGSFGALIPVSANVNGHTVSPGWRYVYKGTYTHRTDTPLRLIQLEDVMTVAKRVVDSFPKALLAQVELASRTLVVKIGDSDAVFVVYAVGEGMGVAAQYDVLGTVLCEFGGEMHTYDNLGAAIVEAHNATHLKES